MCAVMSRLYNYLASPAASSLVIVTSTMQWFSNCDTAQYIIITFKLHQGADRFCVFLYTLKFIILTFTTNKKNVINYKALHSPLFINLSKFFTLFRTL